MVSRICERGSWLGAASVSALCLCCFLAHRFCMALSCCCWSLLFSHAIPIPEVIQCYHLFWYVSDDHELTCWSPAVRFLGCVWFVCVFVLASCLVVLCWLCGLARWQLNGLCIDPCSVLLLVHIVIWECCYCTNSLNLPICISFPAWLTTWREPQGVGRKKKCSLECGCVVIVTLTGPLGARARLVLAVSIAAPISSERIGRNQYVAYRRHSVSGVANAAGCLINEQMYLANYSASRIVTLRATPWKVLSIASEHPRNHSSAAIVRNSLENFSWKGAREMVSLAEKSKDGSAEGWLERHWHSRWDGASPCSIKQRLCHLWKQLN